MSELRKKISTAKEAFGEKAIDVIVNDLKIKDWNDKKKSGICPFHEENTPSFIWDNKHKTFKCFGCGVSYDILDHYQKKGYSFKESIEKLFRETNTDYFIPTTKKKDYKYPKPETNTDMDKVYKYLESRKISKEVVDYAKVRQDSNGNIVFEYYDETDTLLTVKYRPSRKVQKPQIKNWCQKDADTSPILWGMNQAVFGKPLIISEGEIDKLSAIQAGFVNVVSVPFGAGNTSWIEYNWDWLDNFDEIIVCGDNDEAGKKMIEEVVPRLGEWRCKTITYPPPIKHKGEDRVLTDLNEILYFLGEEALHEIISNSKEVPIADIIDLADVQEVDLENTIGIKSGINELDQKIGKFYLGTVAVWTGINGCVDSETEFFNGYEWKKISDYCDDKVLQYNADGGTSLVAPQSYVKIPCDEFYLVKSFYGVNQCVTKEHNMVYLTSKNNIAKIKFTDMLDLHMKSKNGFYGKFITTFGTFGDKKINLTDSEIRLMVAVSADGHYFNIRNNTCRFRVKKERKKERIRRLLNECGISVDERTYNGINEAGYSNFYFKTPLRFKTFPKDWYLAPIEQLKIIFDEVFNWDGYKTSYSSTVKENADFIQYVCSVCGHRASIYVDSRKNKRICYKVNATKTTHPTIKTCKQEKLRDEHIQRYDTHDGFKYCFTVPSGMLVLRRDGNINITGNSGKSTVINQVCLIEAINQNFKTFVFSDELTKTQFKNWIEYPIAGGQNITETPGRDDRPAYYKIDPKIKEIIREWYRGKIYLYDNEFDKSAKTILQRMEIMARKHGIKNFLIDNLMMVDLSCYGGEPLERQKMFVLDLMKFARKFNTVVHLVAHPRKLDIVKRLSKMDVSGTGDITNLAHYVMAIHRVTAKEKEGVKNGKGDWITEPINFDVLLECFKNRPVGFQDFVIGLHYDRKSRRCYKTNEDLFKQYKWDQSKQPSKSTVIIEGGNGESPF